MWSYGCICFLPVLVARIVHVASHYHTNLSIVLNKQIDSYRISTRSLQINEDWLMLKGCVIGCKKRCITLRKSLMSHSRRIHLEVRHFVPIMFLVLLEPVVLLPRPI